jgi:hypothetical protein
VISAERPVPAYEAYERSDLHFCFAAPNAATVDAFHAAALRAGGHDNGAPGLRPAYGSDYYTAFITDPDGYRIEAYYGSGERWGVMRLRSEAQCGLRNHRIAVIACSRLGFARS